MGKQRLQDSTFSFDGSSSNLMVSSTGTKPRMSSNSGRIGYVTLELRAQKVSLHTYTFILEYL